MHFLPCFSDKKYCERDLRRFLAGKTILKNPSFLIGHLIRVHLALNFSSADPWQSS